MKKTIKCPQCEGFGRVFFAFPFTRKAAEGMPCPLCAGAGTAAGEFKIWKERGALLKARRISSGLTLREAANHFSIDASNLSKMERGLMKPTAYCYESTP